MIPVQPVETIGTYAGGNPQYMTEPTGTDFANGVEPLDTLPAGWWNWLWNKITLNEGRTVIVLESLVAEGLSILAEAGIQPDNEQTNQIKNSIKLIAQSYVNALAATKGEPDGIASLDTNGRIPYSQLPESAIELKGTWNASTNTPELEDGVGTNGDFYVVSVAGTWQDIEFYVGDRIIYDSSLNKWVRLGGGNVISVNGKTGEVNLTGEDIPLDTSEGADTLAEAVSENTEGVLSTKESLRRMIARKNLPFVLDMGLSPGSPYSVQKIYHDTLYYISRAQTGGSQAGSTYTILFSKINKYPTSNTRLTSVSIQVPAGGYLSYVINHDTNDVCAVVDSIIYQYKASEEYNTAHVITFSKGALGCLEYYDGMYYAAYSSSDGLKICKSEDLNTWEDLAFADSTAIINPSKMTFVRAFDTLVLVYIRNPTASSYKVTVFYIDSMTTLDSISTVLSTTQIETPYIHPVDKSTYFIGTGGVGAYPILIRRNTIAVFQYNTNVLTTSRISRDVIYIPNASGAIGTDYDYIILFTSGIYDVTQGTPVQIGDYKSPYYIPNVGIACVKSSTSRVCIIPEHATADIGVIQSFRTVSGLFPTNAYIRDDGVLDVITGIVYYLPYESLYEIPCIKAKIQLFENTLF